MNTTYESVLKEASRKQTPAFTFSKTYPAFIVLILALAASLVVWKLVANKVESDNHTAFEKAKTSIMNRFGSSVNEHTQIIRSMQGLYDSYAFVVRDVFELYGSIPVKTSPAIQAVAFAPFVPKGELGEFIHYARSERYYDYNFHPQGERDVYYPTFYIVPLEQNKDLSGFDIATQSELHIAIERAGREKGIVASSFFPYKNPDSLQFALVAPVFKKDTDTLHISGQDVNGVLYVQIRGHEFFRVAIGTGAATDSTITFQCMDTTGGQNRIVYSSKNYASVGTDYTPLFTENVMLPVADRAIAVHFATVPGFGGEFQNRLPLLSFIGAVITSFLLFAFTLSLLTSRARAQDLAERITRSQRRIVESSRDLIGISDLKGVWRSMNPASFAELEFMPEEMIGKPLYDFVLPEDQQQVRAILEGARDEEPTPYEIRMVSKKGSVRWMSWSSTVSQRDGLIYSIGRDVTERKLAEEQIKLKNRQVELARQYTAESTQFKSDFMSKASFYFRTSLTGIIGYLQLVMAKIYSTPEEQNSYIETAFASAEDLLSRVGDLLDVAEGEGTANEDIHIDNLPLKTTFADIVSSIKSSNGNNFSVELQSENTDDYLLNSNRQILSKALYDVVSALMIGSTKNEIQMSVEVNPHENVVELQLLTPLNPQASEMIALLKQASTDTLIETLSKDKNDIMFRIATAMSWIKMMGGRMVVDSLGMDGNVVIISLPVRRVPSLERLKKSMASQV